MGLAIVGDVLDFVRAEEDDGHVTDVKIDPGDGDVSTAHHSGPPGEDSSPLSTDQAVAVRGPGGERWIVVGYLDPHTPPEAARGDKRFYARDPDGDGAVTGVVWLRADGTIDVFNDSGAFQLAADGNVTINGVVIDTDGNVSAPGEVTAKAGGTEQVGVTTHLHAHAMGPTQAPTPNT